MGKVEIFEVGPRDGFQNISSHIDTSLKKEIIDDLYESGINNVQITSFVNPKAVPQMADAAEIAKHVLDNHSEKNRYVLVPNYKGAVLANEAEINSISFVLSISETHNKKNVNKTHNQSIKELKQVRKEFPNHYLILDLATTFGCYFEGETSLKQIEKFINIGYDIGVNEINLCDTFGLANPNLVEEIVKYVKGNFEGITFRVHFHDTRNMGMINSLEAIKNGINRIESSVGGLGGCPFAPGASGNTSTEDLVYMLNKLNYETAIDFPKLLEVAKKLNRKIVGNYSGHHLLIDTKIVKEQ